MNNNLTLPENLRLLVDEHLVLLEPMDDKKKHFKMEIWTGGYTDMMYLIGDLVKVSILALEAPADCHREIRDPNSNISGVLGLILNMLPYEEAELLDILHSAKSGEDARNTCDESYMLLPPDGLY